MHLPCTLVARTAPLAPGTFTISTPQSRRLDAFRNLGPLRRRQNRLRVVDPLCCQLSCPGDQRLDFGENGHWVRILRRRVAKDGGDFVDQRIRFHLEGITGGLKLRGLVRRELELGRVVDGDDVEECVRHETRHARLEGLRIHATARTSANCVVELLACGIRPESKAPLNRNLERNTKCVPRSIGGTKVLVDLVLVTTGRWIESAHIKKRAIGKRWLSPTAKVVAAVQKQIESRERVERDHRDRESAIEAE